LIPGNGFERDFTIVLTKQTHPPHPNNTKTSDKDNLLTWTI